MFPPTCVFFEIGALNILPPLQKLYYILNHFGKVQFQVSPCCYFTSFEVITARAWSPLTLDHKVLWKFHIFCKHQVGKKLFLF